MCDISGSSEEDTQVDQFESGLARGVREADPGKGKGKAAKSKKRGKKAQKKKRKGNNKNAERKKTRSNKRKGLKSKGGKQRKKNRKNSPKKSGKGKKRSEKKNKKKAERRQKKKNGEKKGKKKNGDKKRKRKNGDKKRKRKNGDKKRKRKNGDKKRKRKNQKKRMNSANARNSTCLSTTCVDYAVQAGRLMKDKVLNFEKQDNRISAKSNIGSKKSGKQDVFTPTLARLADAGGGNISAPVCSGNSTSAGALQMTNLSTTLMSCSDDIYAACDTSNLPTPDATYISECKAAIETFKVYHNTCMELTGSAACECWTPSDNVTAAMAVIKDCDLSKNNTLMVAAVKSCKSFFGKCRKYEDAVGDIIFACEQNSDTLKLKLKALSDNSDKVSSVASTVSGIINGSSRAYGKFKRSVDVSSGASYISTCTQINTWVAENPYYYQISSYATAIISVTTVPTFTTVELASLSTVNSALQVSVSTLQVAVVALQTTIYRKYDA